MSAIRRIYVYVVCLISLQLLVGAVNSLAGGLVRQVVVGNDDVFSGIIFQIAIIIVSTPVFLGHWLWAESSARKQADERASIQRRLYIYVTLSVFLLYVMVAAFNGIQAMLRLVFPPEFARLNVNEYTATIISSAITFIFAAVLWFYHRYIAITDEKATPEASGGGLGVFKYLYRLGFSAIGVVMLAIGMSGTLFVLFSLPNSEALDDLPSRIPLLLIGAAVLLPFQFFLLREPQARTGYRNLLRWLYALVFSLMGLGIILFGVYAGQSWLFGLAENSSGVLPTAFAALLTGLPLFIYHELLFHRATRDNPDLTTGRWIYGLLLGSLGAVSGMVGAFAGLQWLFNYFGGEAEQVPVAATLFVMGLSVWLYYHFMAVRRGGDIGIVRRLYYFGFSGLGLVVTVLGLIGLQEWLYSRFAGEGVTRLPAALALLITGLPVWLRFWLWAQDQFNNGGVEEQKSDLRKAYLYLVIFSAVSAVVVTAALLVNGILRAILQLPTEGGLGLPLAIIIAATTLWAYHAFVLRRDIARAGESSLQAGMQRLYWYVVAGVGLAALTLGLAGDISVLVRAIGTFSFPDELREQFAAFTAGWLAGLPVWLIGWVPAQRLAVRDDAAGVDARRSLLRRAYIYGYWLVAILVLLGNAISIVFLILSAIFGLLSSEDVGETLTNLGQSIGYAVIALAVWLYHLVLLRRDNAYTKREQAVVVEQTAAQWENLHAVVVSPEGAPFEPAFMEGLGRELPYLKLVAIQLPPASDPIPDEIVAQLAQAKVIIAPLSLAAPGGALAAYPATKLIVLPEIAGVKWIGANAPASQLAGLIRQTAQEVNAQAAAVVEEPAPPVPPQDPPPPPMIAADETVRIELKPD
jgi:Domain of unknown function (DUF5671)